MHIARTLTALLLLLLAALLVPENLLVEVAVLAVLEVVRQLLPAAVTGP